ncbi:hypothetical protein ACAW74_05120 [Fibrella sp. WM1]|uniref:hypothetical protein n=1 Tax=Fibrella musci TaxID=3242485 RepID=UPI00351FA309
MTTQALQDCVIGGILYLPAVAIGLLIGLASLLLLMIIHPLLIDWLGVRDRKK